MTGRRVFRSSLKWAFVMTWGRRLMGVAVTLVLAAMLGPRTFGVVAIATIFIYFLQVFLDQGLATAIVQREDLEEGHLDSAFWMNVAWSIVLAGAAIGLSSLWADLNNLPELRDVTIVLSVTLVLRGLIIVQQSLLQREMRFKQLALRSNVATLAGGVTGIALALSGAGVWALVAQQIAFDGVSLVLLWAVSDWHPRLSFSRRHARELLGYSASVLFANLAGFFNRRADALFLGMLFGPTVVGIYRLADRLVDTVLELTMRPIGLVSLPHFSRLQNDPAGLRGAVTQCVRLTLLAAVPPLMLLAACSPWVLGVIGEEWVAGSDALVFLCLAGTVKGVVFFTGPLLFAVDRPGLRAGMLWLIAGISTVSVIVVGVALQDAGEADQLLGMSASRAVVFLAIILPLNLLIIHRVTGLTPRALVRWLPAPLAAGGAALAIGFGLEASGLLDGAPPLVGLAVAGTLAGSATVATLMALDATVRSQVARRLPGRKRRGGPRAEPAVPQVDSPTTGAPGRG